ncbi:MAG: protein NO VEIN domain-containing protein [Pseudonocardiaceae bacterium]
MSELVYACTILELVGNKAIEDAAITWVIEIEKLAGRQDQDVRYKRSGGDVDSPPRLIEVKAYGGNARGQDLWLEARQVEHAEATDHFFVYVVENIRQGDPAHFTLRVLDGGHLRRLLGRK